MIAQSHSLSDGDVAFFNFVYAAIFFMLLYSARHHAGGAFTTHWTAFILVFIAQNAMLHGRQQLRRRTLWVARGWATFWALMTFWTTFRLV
jgi:hypothetical protein